MFNPVNILITGGKRRTISTSKIKKITASKKNRREKGRRADPIGSKPHSKGEFFSRSELERLARLHAIPMTSTEMPAAKKEESK